MELSEHAVRLGCHIVTVSEKGLSDPISWQTIADKFTHDDRDHMVEAAFELKSLGLIRVSQGMNVPDGISHIRAEYSLYWTFDGEVYNYNSAADVVTLIELILADENRGDAATLLACLDWTPRRFNPAFAQIVEVIPEGRVRNPLQSDFPVKGILITPEDRVALRALASELSSAIEPPPDNTANDVTSVAPEIDSMINFKVPGTDTEIPVRRNIGIGLVALIVIASLVWYWPQITDRFPNLSIEDPIRLQVWRDDAGKGGLAQLQIPPNPDREREVEIFAQYSAIQDQPGNPWHRLVVSVNGVQQYDTGEVGTKATAENTKSFRFSWAVPKNATVDIRAEATNFRTRHEGLVLEVTELN